MVRMGWCLAILLGLLITTAAASEPLAQLPPTDPVHEDLQLLVSDGLLPGIEIPDSGMSRLDAAYLIRTAYVNAGSLAVEGGVNLGIKADINGTFVPAGIAPDIGAYEFTDFVINDAP